MELGKLTWETGRLETTENMDPFAFNIEEIWNTGREKIHDIPWMRDIISK